MGRLARGPLNGVVLPNHYLSYRPVTSKELRATPELEADDIEALRAWLASYHQQRPTVDDVALVEARPRRPDLVVINLGQSEALTRDRSDILAGLGGILWTYIPLSDELRPSIIAAQILDPMHRDNQQLARSISMEMHTAPAAITLGGLQMAIRTDQGVVEL